MPGLISPSGSDCDYLYGGGIWVGGIRNEDTLLSTSFEGWAYPIEEILAPGESNGYPTGNAQRIGSLATWSHRMLSTDTIHKKYTYQNDMLPSRKHIPLHVRVTTKSYCWQDVPQGNTILLDYTITNIGTDVISGGYLGQYLDADIWTAGDYNSYGDDQVSSIRELGLMYFHDNDGDPYLWNRSPHRLAKALAFAFGPTSRLLPDTNFNWWLASSNSVYDFGPRRKSTPADPFRPFQTGGIGTPLGDHNKYYMLRHPEWDYDLHEMRFINSDDSVWLYPPQSLVGEYSYGTDIRGLLSIGPFDLPPDSSVRIIGSLFVADSVIYRDDLAIFLERFPQYYTQALDLNRIRDQAKVSDSLANVIRSDVRPVTGLALRNQTGSATTIEWDPWVFDDVIRYDIYLAPVDSTLLPYPGVFPPWYVPPRRNWVGSTDPTWTFRFDSLPPDQLLCAEIGSVTRDGRTILSSALPIYGAGLPIPPRMNGTSGFAVNDGAVAISWQPSPDSMVARYRLFRFADTTAYQAAYRPYYAPAPRDAERIPHDSFLVRDTLYYYYEMVPIATVDKWQTGFETSDFQEGDLFAVQSVSRAGVVSELSLPQRAERIAERTKDLLIVTFQSHGTSLVSKDSLRSFYERTAQGLSYDIYWFADSLGLSVCASGSYDCFKWTSLAPYQLVIIDDGLGDNILSPEWQSATRGMTRYIESGGTLAEFGAFSAHQKYNLTSKPKWTRLADSTVRSYFAIDSTYYVGISWAANFTQPPYVDSLLGFVSADAVHPSAPELRFDTTRYPFAPFVRQFWPTGTAPSAAAFKPTSTAEITHRFVSNTPTTSKGHGLPVGIRTILPRTSTYAFGFHLWYMEPAGARKLIDWMLAHTSTAGCCSGFRGNVDGSRDDRIDLNDVAALVDHLFTSGSPLACPEEADLTSDLDGRVDIEDLVFLVDHLFLSRKALNTCGGNEILSKARQSGNWPANGE